MKQYSQPYLEPYTGRASRHQCPQCGDPHSFVYYLDGDTGQPIDKTVGRCNHESSCGYHCTPKQFFTDHPTERGREALPARRKTVQPPQREIAYIPFSYVEQSASYANTFIRFLCSILDTDSLESPTIERLMEDYVIGSTADQAIVYWQIDINGRVRDGKIQHYRADGHRTGGVDWVHSRLRKAGQLKGEKAPQCLFGEHLLRLYPDRVVAIVESEKNALIGSAMFPKYNWLATGCKGGLQIDKLRILAGKTVILFPDVDGYAEWREKAKNITFCKVVVSDLLERNASAEERAQHIDIADWIIKDLSAGRGTELSPQEKILRSMLATNPALQLLIDEFSLELIA